MVVKEFVKGADSKLLESLRERLLIDEDDLDRELIHQPSLFEKVGREYVLAVSRRDAAKKELKVLEANLSFQYRKELEAEGKKPTEAMITALVETDPDGQTAHKSLLILQSSAAELENLKDAFFQRSSVLRDLCNLFSAGYFSRNSVKSPAASQVIDQSDQLRRKRINEERRRE